MESSSSEIQLRSLAWRESCQDRHVTCSSLEEAISHAVCVLRCALLLCARGGQAAPTASASALFRSCNHPVPGSPPDSGWLKAFHTTPCSQHTLLRPGGLPLKSKTPSQTTCRGERPLGMKITPHASENALMQTFVVKVVLKAPDNDYK